ncbi:proline-specific peptidase [Athelia psychrophila]|uniref:Proline-specific peptidase n=1 Tax=Athelia psychrophila TaxID=1759441 RepID=A0A166PZ04_9AGAM|nr:proline-specific peptidase [Fibularhizoctonia sp. CBS 109695]
MSPAKAPSVPDGAVDFDVPSAGKKCATWYKVVGDLADRTHRPLVVLHGGPGMTHGYLTGLSSLASTHNTPIIFYDQLGNGKSTHLPEKKGDIIFWTDQLFLDELDNLLVHLGIQDDYAILGHSWGGMLGARHAALQPKGLKQLVISDSPADMKDWIKASDLLRKRLPQDVQDTLSRHEAAGTFDAQEYVEATDVFDHQFCCRLETWPDNVVKSMQDIEQDPTVYHTLNGPNDFTVVGPLKDWTIVDDIHKIKIPTLLLNGRYDGAQDFTMAPFFRDISKVKWVEFAESAHMPHVEETERYLEVVGDFLTTPL